MQVRPTHTERKRKLRTIYRKYCDKENESLKQQVPASILVEDESIRAYQRKCRLQHFETMLAKRKRSQISHSPNFDSVTWDKEAVLRDLRLHPPAPPPINW